MNERLQQFLAAENISQAAFADTIKVARASVSHVMSGRNLPSYDFLRGVATAFPDLNLDWLITGKGKMYKSKDEPKVQLQVEAPAQNTGGSAYGTLAPEKKVARAPYAAATDVTDTEHESKEDASFGELFDTTPASPVTKNETVAPEKKVAQVPYAAASENSSAVAQMVNSGRRIRKIVIFYDDNSYQEVL